MTTEQRLVRLERENRWMRRAGMLVIACVAVVALAAQAKPASTVEAREFIVKDAEGTVRGRFGITDKRGQVSFLALYDLKGEQCFRVAAAPERGFAFLNMGHVREGTEYLRMTAGPQATSLVMFARNGDTELVIRADETEHSPSVNLHYKGLPVAGMGLADEGKPLLWIRDTKTLETIWKAPND